MALWISRKPNRHGPGESQGIGQHAPSWAGSWSTRNLDENGRSWGSLILAYRHRLRTLATKKSTGHNGSFNGVSYGGIGRFFFHLMFVCSISIYFQRNSWTRHILNFEVRPNWSTSWHLSRRKTSQCEWSMLIPLYMFYLGRVKSGNRNLSRNIEHLFIISSWTVLKVIDKHLQFEIVVIVLVCSGQLFSTSVITTADSARMSIQDATETSWPNNLWHVLWRIPCTVNFCLTLSYLFHPFNVRISWVTLPWCTLQQTMQTFQSGLALREQKAEPLLMHCSLPLITVQWKTA